MKFSRSILPFLSLALLLPIGAGAIQDQTATQKSFDRIVEKAQYARQQANEFARNTIEKARQLPDNVRDLANNTHESVKAGYSKIPSFAELRSSIALKVDNKSFKQVLVDAQDAVISAAKAHPYAAIGAFIATAAITGYLVKRVLFGKRK